MPPPRPGPIVYLPVSLDADGQVADVTMVRLADERVALLAYTALDRLIDCCGEHQPWSIFDVGHLDALNEVKPFDLKYLDVELPPAFRVAPPEEAQA